MTSPTSSETEEQFETPKRRWTVTTIEKRVVSYHFRGDIGADELVERVLEGNLPASPLSEQLDEVVVYDVLMLE